jgi:hypothetical protein
MRKQEMKHFVHLSLFICVALITSSTAHGDLLIRIGDVDGFGYGAATGFKSAAGDNANVDGQGNLGSLDFLPDINENGFVQHHQGDNFDFRDEQEADDAKVEHCDCVTIFPGAPANLGSKYTDISLTTSYTEARQNTPPSILVGGNPIDGLVRGAGSPFPTGRASTNLNADPQRGNQPGFHFQFAVDKSALSYGAPIFFNTLLADFDVPTTVGDGVAYLRIQPQFGDEQQLVLRRQNNSAGEDGLIQGATRELAFDEVFQDAGAYWAGGVEVHFFAPNEPYTAFDFAELSTTALIPKLTGDFQDDGDVDLYDYNLWKQNFGTSNPAADANGNGTVDAADYTIWRDNLSTNLTGAASFAALPELGVIPEPSTALLLLLALTGCIIARRTILQ